MYGSNSIASSNHFKDNFLIDLIFPTLGKAWQFQFTNLYPACYFIHCFDLFDFDLDPIDFSLSDWHLDHQIIKQVYSKHLMINH